MDSQQMIESLTSELPLHLRERTRIHRRSATEHCEFVVYWMRTALRVDENPALDVAIEFAHKLNIPLLVYHGLSEKYRYASDRHHAFILQGARDLQPQFAEKNISYVFHLENYNNRDTHLKTLTNRSSIVVTEDMPVDPPRKFLKALSRATSANIVCVDTACIVPMQLLKKAYTRAFEFRSATQRLLTERLTRAWPASSINVQPLNTDSLPFNPLDFSTCDIADLVASCDIDHSVGPVVDTIGGSQAGYARWNNFKSNKLAGYARRRNDALDDGVSRMSAYLHYGMVSPFRIAREAAAIRNAGAEKYLDELITWRELAYNFCFHRPDHNLWSAIPEWAQATLQAHSNDKRAATFSWEELARGSTGYKLWDAAQLSLIRHGELHNNLRMTWGKAFLDWTKSLRQALQFMIDLNHRFALDGRDPASYGGLLWCLGQFDRPFEPEQPIIGTVRPRSLSEHARRLDADKFFDRIAKPRSTKTPTVAIVGAGIAGLTAARILQDHGLAVKVFEKSRGVGGRVATRRFDDGTTFDHGAQYFTARDERFRRYIDSWVHQGIVGSWSATHDQRIVVLEKGIIKSESNSTDRFVATPNMNSLCKHLSNGIPLDVGTRVHRLKKTEIQWQVLDEANESLGLFDQVILAIPAPQAADLVSDFVGFAESFAKVEIKPCWALMIRLEEPLGLDWGGAFIHDSPISWIARNSTKPGRNSEHETFVVHASGDWSASNLEQEPDQIQRELLEAFWQAIGCSPISIRDVAVHRWRYAIPTVMSASRCLYDRQLGIAACGDWAGGPRVEGAFLSGSAAAGRILGTLEPHTSEIAATQLDLFEHGLP
jgi:photolyase PhrII